MTHVILDVRSGWLWRRGVAASLAFVVAATPACVAATVAAHPVTLGSDSAQVVRQRAKAQLIDGSIVTLPQGFRVEGSQLVGSGWRFAPTLHDSVHVSAIPRDSVAGVVTYGMSINAAKSVGMSAVAAVMLAFALVAVYVAGCVATSCLR